MEQNYFICHEKKRWNVKHVMRKGEFGSLWSESLGFKCNTLIMFGPNKLLLWFVESCHIYAIPTKGLRNITFNDKLSIKFYRYKKEP